MNATACHFVNWMEHENTEIARGLRGRDPDLFDRLIEQYQHRLLRYLVYLTGSREAAEDLFQETWLRVLERGGQYDGKHNFSTWLFTVARNLSIDVLRRKRLVSLDAPTEDDRGPLTIEDTGQKSAFDVVASQEERESIEKALRGIPAEYREAIVLRYHEELALEEIAAITRVPLATAKSRVYRGLTALMQRLKGAKG
jgi:RNA polymerase sigma-70 factor, ECF subfamily